MTNPEIIEIKNQKTGESLKNNLYKSSIPSNKFLLMVGGSGDDRNYFNPIFTSIQKQTGSLNIISFSFRGYETKKDYPPRQQIQDLKEVMHFITSRFSNPKIYLICTSYGALSSVYILTSPKFGNFIKQAVLLDPADYYLELDKSGEPNTWDGNHVYNPTKKTASSMMKKQTSDTIVDVVHFTIRNFLPGGWGDTPYNLRGQDNPDHHPRLNSNMVKSFYTNTNSRNRGRYLEINNIPHAFMRDGDINKNIINVTNLIIDLLKIR